MPHFYQKPTWLFPYPSLFHSRTFCVYHRTNLDRRPDHTIFSFLFFFFLSFISDTTDCSWLKIGWKCNIPKLFAIQNIISMFRLFSVYFTVYHCHQNRSRLTSSVLSFLAAACYAVLKIDDPAIQIFLMT